MFITFKARVYRNLRKNTFSIQKKTNKGWRVFCHLDELILSNVEFKIYEAGRSRVLKEKKKNVHAFVVGDITLSETKNYFGQQFYYCPIYLNEYDYERGFKSFTYNPYNSNHFQDRRTGENLTKAKYVLLDCSSEFGISSVYCA
jgi:hypothetical protein